MERYLAPDQAAAVARTIQHLAERRGVPLRISATGPRGENYLVVTPDTDHAPAIIYREMSPGEDGSYLVAAVVDRDTFREYQRAEQQGLLDDPAVQALAAAIAGVNQHWSRP
jgi:hypothetical protein